MSCPHFTAHSKLKSEARLCTLATLLSSHLLFSQIHRFQTCVLREGCVFIGGAVRRASGDQDLQPFQTHYRHLRAHIRLTAAAEGTRHKSGAHHFPDIHNFNSNRLCQAICRSGVPAVCGPACYPVFRLALVSGTVVRVHANIF